MAAGVLFDLERLASGAGRDLLEEVNDSKRLAPAKRERLAQAVLAHAEAVSLVSIPASQIDRIGIDPANLACLERALRALGERAELRLVDGRLALGAGAPVHELIVRGDATSATIAAASIVAKVARDRLMARLGERYPGYGFERHKGYGTTEHKVAVAKLGPTPEHRLSFNFRCLAEAVVAAPSSSPEAAPCLLARAARRRDGRPPARDAHDRRPGLDGRAASAPRDPDRLHSPGPARRDGAGRGFGGRDRRDGDRQRSPRVREAAQADVTESGLAAESLPTRIRTPTRATD